MKIDVTGVTAARATRVGGGGWVESIIRLISAEAEAWLDLAELGNYFGTSFIYSEDLMSELSSNCHLI